MKENKESNKGIKKMKTSKNQCIMIGDKIEGSSRKGRKQFVVVSIVRGRRNGRYTLKMSEVGNPTSIWTWRNLRSSMYSEQKDLTFIGKSNSKVVEQTRGEIIKREDKKIEQVKSAKEKVEKLEIKAGDRVLVDGRPYSWSAVVGEVRGDRVGLVRNNGRRVDPTVEMFSGLFSMRKSRRAPREFRWIPGSAIIKNYGKPE